jgi:hypothetical protein
MKTITEVQVTKPFKFWCAAHEAPDKTSPYEHTHVLVDWGCRFTWRNVNLFDWIWSNKGVWKGKSKDLPIKEGGRRSHPHVQIVGRKRDDFKRCTEYLGKQDPENADLAAPPSIVKAVWKCETQDDALVKHCKNPSQVIGIMALYDAKPSKPIQTTIKPKYWQREAINLFEHNPSSDSTTSDEIDGFVPGHWISYKDTDGKKVRKWIPAVTVPQLTKMKTGSDRVIMVFHNPDGCTGKTAFCRFLNSADPTRFLFLPGLGSTKDLASTMLKALKKGWTGHSLLVDLTRQKADCNIYETLEQLRNGSMLALKWAGEPVHWKSVHLALFTNWMPKIKAVSTDRWEIYTIKNLCLNYVPTDEAEEIRRQEQSARSNDADR